DISLWPQDYRLTQRRAPFETAPAATLQDKAAVSKDAEPPIQPPLRCGPESRGPSNIDGGKSAAYLGRMALLPIITAPDPRLKITARPVAKVDAEVRRLMDDMLETMYHAIGIGLAAPQVGVAKRVLVIDVARDGEKPNPM